MAHKDCNQNLKYISRCHYYGKLINWEYVASALILILRVYTATELFGGTQIIRVYIPSEMERDLIPCLNVGEFYFVIAAPYKRTFKEIYKHRVDLGLNIFKEIGR